MKAVLVYTEHRREVGALPKIAYGPRLKAAAVYLNMVGMIAYQRLSDFFREISHGYLKVSKASLEGFTRSAAKAIHLGGSMEELLNGRVVHVDETPVRTAEQKATYILRTEPAAQGMKYYAPFTDGQAVFHDVEISYEVFQELQRFIKQERNLKWWSERHIEQSQLSMDGLVFTMGMGSPCKPIHISYDSLAICFISSRILFSLRCSLSQL